MIFTAAPVRLAPNGGSLYRLSTGYSSFSSPNIQLLGYHITFPPFVNRIFPVFPRKMYDLPLIVEGHTRLISFMSLISVELGRVSVDTPQKHLPVPEFHQLRTGLLMKGHHTALGIYPQLPDRFPGHCRFHRACFSFHTHMTPSAPLGAVFVPAPIRRFEHRFCCTFFQKIFKIFKPAEAAPPDRSPRRSSPAGNSWH